MTIFVLTFILSFLFVIFNNKISKLVNIFDYPDKKRKLHKVVSSPIGGVLVFLITILFIIDLFFLKEFFLGNDISLTGREALVFIFGFFSLIALTLKLFRFCFSIFNLFSAFFIFSTF